MIFLILMLIHGNSYVKFERNYSPVLLKEEDLFNFKQAELRSPSSSQIIPYNNRRQFYKILRIFTLIDKNMTLVRNL